MNRDLDYLEFLLECIDHLKNYTKDVDEDSFLRNEEKKDACLTRIVMIGEYSARISDDLKDKFTNVEWELMKSTRNYYVHVYRGVDWRRVWETIQKDIPPLRIKVEKILSQL
ncbi:MAG: HepT-like ribonuclease domain-containing protein [Ginsengibacter sp.]